MDRSERTPVQLITVIINQTLGEPDAKECHASGARLRHALGPLNIPTRYASFNQMAAALFNPSHSFGLLGSNAAYKFQSILDD
jgi:hypothetical protein